MKYNKKASPFLVLKVLEEYSDEGHYLTQAEIISKVQELYDLELERKSVSATLKLLEELGYDINKNPKGGYYLLSRLFDRTEARFLNDAIFSSKAISGKEAKNLSKKINSIFSVHQRVEYSYLLKSEELNRPSSNNDIFFNIDVLEDAIRSMKAISFNYRGYDEDGNEIDKMGGYRYHVSPYYTINNFGRYYLLCHYRSKYAPVQVFRLDYMRDVRIADDWGYKSIEEVTGNPSFSISDYLNERLYLFSGAPIKAKIRIDSPSNGIQAIKDWFGYNAKIEKEGDQLILNCECDENSLFYWLAQYGDDVTLLKPKSIIDKLKEYFARQMNKYGD